MEKDGDYVLRIRDNVSSYNPFESDGDEIDSGVLTLIQKKTKYCDYQRKMIFNYLYMIIEGDSHRAESTRFSGEN